jgi:16S rRNA (guanine(966)-N(2))-methyltransferase RsmD
MRIISGSARGTKLFTLDGEKTRPTLDRVKEPLFNIINFNLPDAVVLDLFAGSGALGLESLSRGAKKTVFCDRNFEAIQVIKKNVDKTRFNEKSIIIQNDFSQALEFLQREGYKFDLIFLDPPYKTDYIYESLNLIIKNNLGCDGTLIVAETDEPERIKSKLSDLNIEIYDTRKYGRAYLLFIKIKD